MSKTLLQAFCHDQLAAHAAPRRRGKRRGERIGFPLAKRRAALACLYAQAVSSRRDKGLRTLAKELHVTYGVLREWRSEPAFKEYVTFLYAEFAQHFLTFTTATYGKLIAGWDAFRAQSIAEFCEAPHFPSVFAELQATLRDARLYAPAVKVLIADRLRREAARMGPGDPAAGLFFGIVLGFLGVPDAEVEVAIRDAREAVIGRLLESIEEVLKSPRARLADRKDALVALACLRNELLGGQVKT